MCTVLFVRHASETEKRFVWCSHLKHFKHVKRCEGHAKVYTLYTSLLLKDSLSVCSSKDKSVNSMEEDSKLKVVEHRFVTLLCACTSDIQWWTWTLKTVKIFVQNQHNLLSHHKLWWMVGVPKIATLLRSQIGSFPFYFFFHFF